MVCPKCQDLQSKVVDKRSAKSNLAIRRRRECLNCGFRFTTYENLENTSVLVRKKTDRIEEFSRNKLKNSILKGLKKRPISDEKIETFLDKLELKFAKEQMSIVESKQIGDEVLNWLKDIDKVAYLLYAIVYLDFDSISEINLELNKLQTFSN